MQIRPRAVFGFLIIVLGCLSLFASFLTLKEFSEFSIFEFFAEGNLACETEIEEEGGRYSEYSDDVKLLNCIEDSSRFGFALALFYFFVIGFCGILSITFLVVGYLIYRKRFLIIVLGSLFVIPSLWAVM